MGATNFENVFWSLALVLLAPDWVCIQDSRRVVKVAVGLLLGFPVRLPIQQLFRRPAAVLTGLRDWP